MDTVTYPDHNVAQFIEKHFAPAKVIAKDNPKIVNEYNVVWTPSTIITDEHGKVVHRVEGFLKPDDFIAQLSLAAGRYHLNRKEFEQAAERYQEVIDKHSGTSAAAKALYWLGITNYKKTSDHKQLHSAWDRLAKEYPNSGWAKSTQVPEQC